MHASASSVDLPASASGLTPTRTLHKAHSFSESELSKYGSPPRWSPPSTSLIHSPQIRPQQRTILKSGTLQRKRKRLIGKGWKSYWAVLYSSKELHLHSSMENWTANEKPEKIVELKDGCSLGVADNAGKPHCFGLFLQKNDVFFCAPSIHAMEEWMKAFSVVLGVQSDTVGLQDFEMLALVGVGAFGKVIQVKKTDTGEIFAMKVLKKVDVITTNQVSATQAEKRVLEVVQHPFIVRLYYAFQTADKLCFVMDFVNGGDIYSLIQKQGKFPEEWTRFYSSQIVLALEYLHDMGIVYRDLKPENVLLDKDGYIRLTDFGLSKDAVAGRTFSLVGSPYYIAPEIVLKRGHDQGVDWWSLGILMYEMIHGIPPFYDPTGSTHNSYRRLLEDPLEFPLEISAAARAVLQNFITVDPTARLGATRPAPATHDGKPRHTRDAVDIRSHPFFASVDWNQLFEKKETPPFNPVVRNPTDISNFDLLPEITLGQFDSVKEEGDALFFEGFDFYAAQDVRTSPTNAERQSVSRDTFSFHRLLVPVDATSNSTQAVQVAAELCKLQGAESSHVTLVTIVETHRGPADAVAKEDEKIYGLLQRYKAQFLGYDVNHVNEKVIVNNENASIPHLILKEAREHDLIVMATSGRSGIGRAVLGSVAESLIRSKTMPVLAVRGKEYGRMAASGLLSFNRICVPIDGTSLSLNALRYAVQFAAAIKCSTIVALTVGKPPEERSIDLLRRAIASAERKESGVSVVARVVVTHKGPTEAILDVMGDYDLFVMGTKGRKGFKRLALGSVTESLLRSSSVPVIVVPWKREGEYVQVSTPIPSMSRAKSHELQPKGPDNSNPLIPKATEFIDECEWDYMRVIQGMLSAIVNKEQIGLVLADETESPRAMVEAQSHPDISKLKEAFRDQLVVAEAALAQAET